MRHHHHHRNGEHSRDVPGRTNTWSIIPGLGASSQDLDGRYVTWLIATVGGFNQPNWKNMLVKLDDSPQVGVKIPKIFETTIQITMVIVVSPLNGVGGGTPSKRPKRLQKQAGMILPSRVTDLTCGGRGGNPGIVGYRVHRTECMETYM